MYHKSTGNRRLLHRLSYIQRDSNMATYLYLDIIHFATYTINYAAWHNSGKLTIRHPLVVIKKLVRKCPGPRDSLRLTQHQNQNGKLHLEVQDQDQIKSQDKSCILQPQDQTNTQYRVPPPPGKSWIFSLKFQDLESPGKSLWSWKVLEIKAYGPGKSWKNIIESHAFF